MKKTLLLLYIIQLLLNVTSSCSQSAWFWQQPLPTGNFLYAVDFLNENTGYAVGTVGTIMRTTNGGLNWNVININSGQLYLSSVNAIDENIVMSSNNNFYRSSNGGDNWTQVFSNSGNSLFFLDFPTVNMGFAAGGFGIIYNSTDKGLTWNPQNSGVTSAIYDISFSDSLHGIVAVRNGILRTTNGGSNWIFSNFNLMAFDLVASCSQPDSINMYAITGFNDLYKSTNGGLKWINSKLPIDPSDIPRDCSFPNKDTGYVTTSYGNILITTNSGTDWRIDSSYNPVYYQIGVLQSVFALNNDHAFISGSGGIVIKTINTGINWITTTGGGDNLESNFFVNENTGYTVGYDGIILKTTNAGNNWLQQASNTTQNLNDVFFVNSETGYVCGDSGVVLKTTNGGILWNVQQYNEIIRLNSIFFYNENVGYSVGKGGKILKTINAGENWEIIPLKFTAELYTTYFLSEEEGYSLTSINTYRTTNGGLNWDLIYPLGGNELQFTDSVTAYNAGGNAKVSKTTNKGLNWVVQNLNISGETMSLHFLNSDNGYAVTRSGQISKTTNGGNIWIPQATITNNNFKSVFFTDADNGYISGDFGTILKTTNGGMVYISSNNDFTPNNFSLSQNYPNPFNSSTVIKYEIKVPAEVKLKLYNIEGKEILTMVNEYQNAGSYEVLFDASELSTGIYFYSLYSNSILLKTKKISLIK